MARRHLDEYQHLAPGLAEFAAMDVNDRRRRAARDELVAGFMPVARNIARRFSRRGEPVDDLEQVAAIGLIHAVERFEPARGHDFLSYCVPTITGEIRRYFRDSTWTVHTPRGIKDRVVAVKAATGRLSTSLGRAPTVGELAADLGASRDDVAEAIAAEGSYQPASLDQALPAGEDAVGSADARLIDVLTVDDPDLTRAEDRVLVRDLVRRLPARERTILVLRFVHDRTQAEIGTELSISQMHVSRLLASTLELLRERLDHPLARLDRPTSPRTATGQVSCSPAA